MGDESGVEVMLDALSGRPNPTWTLSPDEVEQLRNRLQPAAAGTAEAAEAAEQKDPINLGYRGFLVRTIGQQEGIPASFRVFRSVITIHGKDRRRQMRDHRGVEQYLTELANKRGHERIVGAPGEPT